MSTDDIRISAISQLKKTHENFTVGIGIAIGVIFMFYFFSFAAFIDHVKPGLVTFQAITTVLLVFCLIYLKRVALYCSKLKYRNQEPHHQLLQQLKHTDFEKDEKSLYDIVAMTDTKK